MHIPPRTTGNSGNGDAGHPGEGPRRRLHSPRVHTAVLCSAAAVPGGTGDDLTNLPVRLEGLAPRLPGSSARCLTPPHCCD